MRIRIVVFCARLKPTCPLKLFLREDLLAKSMASQSISSKAEPIAPLPEDTAPGTDPFAGLACPLPQLRGHERQEHGSLLNLRENRHLLGGRILASHLSAVEADVQQLARSVIESLNIRVLTPGESRPQHNFSLGQDLYRLLNTADKRAVAELYTTCERCEPRRQNEALRKVLDARSLTAEEIADIGELFSIHFSPLADPLEKAAVIAAFSNAIASSSLLPAASREAILKAQKNLSSSFRALQEFIQAQEETRRAAEAAASKRETAARAERARLQQQPSRELLENAGSFYARQCDDEARRRFARLADELAGAIEEVARGKRRHAQTRAHN